LKFRPLAVLAAAALLQGTGAPVLADPAAGAYLAARQARYVHDFAAAAEYYTRALADDPANPAILESTVLAQVSLGRFDLALPVARRLEEAGLRSQVGHMVLMGKEARQGDFDAVLRRIEDNRGIGQLGDGLLAAWATLGQGDMTTALDRFDDVATQRGLHSFAIYHKALALASVGDFEAADAIFSGDAEGPMQTTRRGTMAWAEVLSQLERNDEAITVIDETFGASLDPELAALRARLARGERIPFSRITGAVEGIAEVYYSLGRALMTEAGEDYVLLYARVAEYLSESHMDARMMSAELLEALERFDLAVKAYKRIPRDHPKFQSAELGRAEALRRSGKVHAAVEVLEQLAQVQPNEPPVHVSLGDLHRQLKQFEEAVEAYDRALDLYEARGTDQWFVHYVRGISFERLGEWDRAETDLRRALELEPDQPQVLNYLGYSLVEQKTKLDEALELIERAVSARPDSGYIVDSLGWVLYRLGRYDEAISHMERAAELMPVDPVVNDHLGDVLWAVGRKTEARFQWKRALSFVNKDDPSPDVDPARMRRKLEVGLDRVLEEEGAGPLKVSNDDS